MYFNNKKIPTSDSSFRAFFFVKKYCFSLAKELNFYYLKEYHIKQLLRITIKVMTILQKVDATKVNQLDIMKTEIKRYLRFGFYHSYRLPKKSRTLEDGFQFLVDQGVFKTDKNIYGTEFIIKQSEFNSDEDIDGRGFPIDKDTTVFLYNSSQDFSGNGLFVVSYSPMHRDSDGWLVTLYPYIRND